MPTRERLLRLGAALVGFLLLVAAADAQTLRASKTEEPPPAELAGAVRAAFAPGGADVVQSGSTTLTFWWIASLDASGSGDGWAGVPEGALVGAVRVSEPYPDIRGRRIKPGVYTLRIALQPMNGDHLGVSPHREFLLVCPAAGDPDVKPTGYQGAVDRSKHTTGAAHPAVWSLDPPVATDAVSTVFRNDAGHEGVVFQVRTSRGPITFGLILIGKIEA